MSSINKAKFEYLCLVFRMPTSFSVRCWISWRKRWSEPPEPKRRKNQECSTAVFVLHPFPVPVPHPVIQFTCVFPKWLHSLTTVLSPWGKPCHLQMELIWCLLRFCFGVVLLDVGIFWMLLLNYILRHLQDDLCHTRHTLTHVGSKRSKESFVFPFWMWVNMFFSWFLLLLFFIFFLFFPFSSSSSEIAVKWWSFFSPIQSTYQFPNFRTSTDDASTDHRALCIDKASPTGHKALLTDRASPVGKASPSDLKASPMGKASPTNARASPSDHKVSFSDHQFSPTEDRALVAESSPQLSISAMLINPTYANFEFEVIHTFQCTMWVFFHILLACIFELFSNLWQNFFVFFWEALYVTAFLPWLRIIAFELFPLRPDLMTLTLFQGHSFTEIILLLGLAFFISLRCELC